MIAARGLYKYYGSIPALVDCDLFVEKGGFLAITGPSGSGKSTLLNLLGCIDTPDAGKYLVDGVDVRRLSARERAKLRGGTIGFVFQSFFLIPQLTAAGNIELPLLFRGDPVSERRERVTVMLERLGLADRAEHFPNQLSGGQRQRVAIGRALIRDPKLILADEPTGNLDPTSGGEVMEFFCELNRAGRTVVMITHDEGVASYARKRVRIEDGRLKEVAPSTYAIT